MGYQTMKTSPALSTTTGILLVSAIFVATLYYWSRRRRLFQLAAKIPGPPTLPLFGNALQFRSVRTDTLRDFVANLIEEFGGTLRLWFGPILVVAITKPEDIDICLNSSNLIDKGFAYSKMKDFLGNGLLTAPGDIWKRHRRIINPVFHMSVLKEFVEIFDRQSQITGDRLEKRLHKTIDILPLLRDCALDMIGETVMETTFGAQSDEKVSKVGFAAEKIMAIMAHRSFHIWLYWDWLFYKTRMGREYRKQLNFVLDFVNTFLELKKREYAADKQTRKVSISKRKSFFNLLMSLNEEEGSFSDQELQDEVRSMIVGGYETTSTTLAFVIVMLAVHQEVQKKVFEEIKSVEKMLEGRNIEADDLQFFPYTDMVIKESLRLYPVAPIITRKAKEEVQLASCTVPKGAEVYIFFFHTHRDPAHWKNPEEFNPDNFLHENAIDRHPYAFQPFSGGPRRCIGPAYASMSMRVILFNLLQRFRVTTDYEMKEIKLSIDVTLKMTDGFNVKFEPRE